MTTEQKINPLRTHDVQLASNYTNLILTHSSLTKKNADINQIAEGISFAWSLSGNEDESLFLKIIRTILPKKIYQYFKLKQIKTVAEFVSLLLKKFQAAAISDNEIISQINQANQKRKETLTQFANRLEIMGEKYCDAIKIKGHNHHVEKYLMSQNRELIMEIFVKGIKDKKLRSIVNLNSMDKNLSDLLATAKLYQLRLEREKNWISEENQRVYLKNYHLNTNNLFRMSSNCNVTKQKRDKKKNSCVKQSSEATQTNDAQMHNTAGASSYSAQPLTHKEDIIIREPLVHQGEQNIGLIQSLDSDSRSNSSTRVSTSSFDSGKPSSYGTSGFIGDEVPSRKMNNGSTSSSFGVGGSGTLDTNLLIPSSSSMSSISIGIGSVDRNMHKNEHIEWLRGLCLEKYAPLFSGYDLPTISRMTPDDLLAIGIKKGRHRKRIKQHVYALIFKN